ncbi:hypothetical protein YASMINEVIRUS_96 [Yasminevirus sp. GU-2018]|uniref:RING-type domain-containing protein n=1 Tax=Yasminevirus sp. GU-2018 TaxID=2420051 RepID=A0A5K0U8H6_9VIRU|nr:hypothetical protein YASMINEVIRUS_96 [Yasminevirus sp. GU-2018]
MSKGLDNKAVKSVKDMSASEKKKIRDKIEEQIMAGDFGFVNNYTNEEKTELFTNRIIKLLNEKTGVKSEKQQKGQKSTHVKKDPIEVDNTDIDRAVDIEIQDIEKNGVRLTNKDKKLLREKLLSKKMVDIDADIARVHNEKILAESELSQKKKELNAVTNELEDEVIDAVMNMGLSAKCGICLCLVRNNCVITPCFHTSMCEECLIGLRAQNGLKTCPMCRGPVHSFNRLYAG